MSDNMKQKPNPPKMGHGGGGRVVEKPKDFKGTMSKLLSHLKPYYFKLFIVVIFAIGSSIFSITAPTILGSGINQIYNDVMQKMQTGTGGIDFNALAKISLTLLSVYILSAVFMFIQNFIVTGVAQKVSYNFRKDISEKINKLPLKYFDTKSYGEVMSRVTNDVDTVSQTLNQSLSQIITSVTTIIGVFIMMVKISPLMTLIAILIIPVSLLIVITIVKVSQKYFKRQQEALGNVNGQIEEVFSGHLLVQAFNNEEKSFNDFEVFNNQLYTSAWKSQFLSGVMMPSMNFVGNVGYVVVCILGGWMAISGKIQVGYITAFIQYIRSFTQPLSQIAQISNLLQSTAAASERVFEFLEEKEEIPETKNPVSTDEIKGNVEFKNVHFGYNEDKIIINNFTADITKGQKVAIVGPTGAGKTTLVKLLMRFYELNGGEIKIDGHNINNFLRKDLRRLFAMVLQDTWLFNGTIMENIRYGNLDASDEEVVKAAKTVNIHRFIKTLPGGYNMLLNEETTNISQGQRQLLTIARAVLSDSKILILDEATSSVDTRTEVLIQEGIAKLMEGRTSFIIAHRLSTIKDADLILVLDNGDIVEQGNHKELLTKEGFYYRLYNSQFEEV